MVEITEENLNDLKFDGIIVEVPKCKQPDGAHNDISFIFECAYYSQGKHGYSEKGVNPNNSAFFSIAYNHFYLPKGLFFNSTSRLTLEGAFHYKDRYRYYKFENMEEFCKWYLDYIKPQEQKTWSQEKCGTNTPPTCVPENPSVGNKKKQTRREKYKDILTILELNDFIHDTKDMMTNVKNGHDPHTFEMLCKQLERCYNRLDEFLDEEI